MIARLGRVVVDVPEVLFGGLGLVLLLVVGLWIGLFEIRIGWGQDLPDGIEQTLPAVVALAVPRAEAADLDGIRRRLAAALNTPGCDVRLALRGDPAREERIEAFGWCEATQP